MLGKKGLHVRFQLEKCYQNNDLFPLGFEKVSKMQTSLTVSKSQMLARTSYYHTKKIVCVRSADKLHNIS